jgi:hypothetical protein
VTGVALVWSPVNSGPEGLISVGRQLLILKTPLLLAALVSLAWLATSLARVPPLVLAVSLGLSIGWAFSLHLIEDVTASQRLRRQNLATTQRLERAIPTHSALLAYWGAKDAAIPLVMTRNVVILDARADEGKDAPMLIQALLAQKRRVFFLASGFPPEVRERTLAGVRLIELPDPHGLPIFEVLPGAGR